MLFAVHAGASLDNPDLGTGEGPGPEPGACAAPRWGVEVEDDGTEDCRGCCCDWCCCCGRGLLSLLKLVLPPPPRCW